MGLLGNIIGLAIKVVKLVRGKASFGSVGVEMFAQLPLVVSGALRAGKIGTVENVREFLADFDLRSGNDPEAMDVFKKLPNDKEEIFFDGLKQAVEVYVMYRLRQEGYYLDPDVTEETVEEVDTVS